MACALAGYSTCNATENRATQSHHNAEQKHQKKQKGRKGRRTFCASDTVSMANPTAHSTMPTTSRAVPNAGFDFDAGSETAGELSTTTGKDTVQTCAIRQPHRPHTVPSRSVISFLKKTKTSRVRQCVPIKFALRGANPTFMK